MNYDIKQLNYLIVGFGNIGSCVYAILKKNNFNVDVYTSKKYIDSVNLEIHDVHQGSYNVSHYDFIKKYHVIVFTTPCFCYQLRLRELRDQIDANTIIIGMPGGLLDVYTKEFNANTIFYERVPFIARYQKDVAHVTGMKNYNHSVYINNQDLKNFCDQFSHVMNNQHNHYFDSVNEVNLNNSNPLLHTARLYTAEGNDQYFYRDWTLNASRIYYEMDCELGKIKSRLQLNHTDILTHYQVNNIQELTDKIKNTKSMSSVLMYNDPDHRLYTEDIKYKLLYIYYIAQKYNIGVPVIEKTLLWGFEKMKLSLTFAEFES